MEDTDVGEPMLLEPLVQTILEIGVGVGDKDAGLSHSTTPPGKFRL